MMQQNLHFREGEPDSILEYQGWYLKEKIPKIKNNFYQKLFVKHMYAVDHTE